MTLHELVKNHYSDLELNEISRIILFKTDLLKKVLSSFILDFRSLSNQSLTAKFRKDNNLIEFSDLCEYLDKLVDEIDDLIAGPLGALELEAQCGSDGSEIRINEYIEKFKGIDEDMLKKLLRLEDEQ